MHNLRRFTLLAGLFFCTVGMTPGPWNASQVQLGRYLAPGSQPLVLNRLAFAFGVRAGVAAYLKAVPGQSGTEPPLDASAAAMREGAAIYVDACAACHTAQGNAAHVFTTLSDAPSLIRVVLEGAKQGTPMPAFGWVLSDAQVAAVVTYVRNSWGNAAPAVAADEVRGARDNLAESLVQGGGQGNGQGNGQ